MSITDSRNLKGDPQESNRRRFIKRHRQAIKETINNNIHKKKLKDFKKGDKVIVRPDAEPSLDYDQDCDKKHVLPGNDRFNAGDTIPKPTENSGQGRGTGGSGEGEDDFSFYLSADELIDLYFEDMELPDLLKKQLKAEIHYILKTGGFSKEGIPPRLSIKKTFENAIARRIANRKEGHKSPYLDDNDLRYIRKYRVPEPYTKAVMFAVMDVSGSMTQHHKKLAKKFYVLLFLFLNKFYKEVDVVFIRYHSYAKEVDEEEFFYGKDTGGTLVHEGIALMDDIIDKRYNLNTTNIYAALASDGDIWEQDIKPTQQEVTKVLPKLQYMSYIQVSDPGQYYQTTSPDLEMVLNEMKNEKLGFARASYEKEVYPALRELFKKKGIE